VTHVTTERIELDIRDPHQAADSPAAAPVIAPPESALLLRLPPEKLKLLAASPLSNPTVRRLSPVEMAPCTSGRMTTSENPLCANSALIPSRVKKRR
jgi:hypothetical protein